MTREDLAKAQEWMRRLIASTLWGGAGRDSMPLGAVVLEMPVALVEDPATMGVWTMSTLFAAPLSDVALWLSGGSSAGMSEEALGVLALREEVADPEAFERRKDIWSARQESARPLGAGHGLGAHMGMGFLARGAADHGAAAIGELVDLDGLRGAKAMLCARIVGRVAREGAFGAAAARAFGVVEARLGPLSFCWQNGSGRVPSAKCRGPGSLARAWPESKEKWIQMHAARREAWDLRQGLGAGPGRGALRV